MKYAGVLFLPFFIGLTGIQNKNVTPEGFAGKAYSIHYSSFQGGCGLFDKTGHFTSDFAPYSGTWTEIGQGTSLWAIVFADGSFALGYSVSDGAVFFGVWYKVGSVQSITGVVLPQGCG